MSRYVRIAPKFWQDENVVLLSEDERFLFLYILTSPHSNMVGCYVLPPPYAMHDLGWEKERYVGAMEGLVEQKVVYYDTRTHVLLVPNFLKYNGIQNSNQSIGAVKALKELPETPLLDKFFDVLLCHTDKFLKPFIESFPKHFEKRSIKQETGTEKGTEGKEVVEVGEEVIVTGSDKNSHVPYQKISEMYHRICKSLPTLATFSENRKKHVRARWKQYGESLEPFEELFTLAESSDFLKGANEKGWHADFDWLMKDANMAKTLEGKYNKNGTTPPRGGPVNPAFVKKGRRSD